MPKLLWIISFYKDFHIVLYVHWVILKERLLWTKKTLQNKARVFQSRKIVKKTQQIPVYKIIRFWEGKIEDMNHQWNNMNLHENKG